MIHITILHLIIGCVSMISAIMALLCYIEGDCRRSSHGMRLSIHKAGWGNHFDMEYLCIPLGLLSLTGAIWVSQGSLMIGSGIIGLAILVTLLICGRHENGRSHLLVVISFGICKVMQLIGTSALQYISTDNRRARAAERMIRRQKQAARRKRTQQGKQLGGKLQPIPLVSKQEGLDRAS